MAYKIETVEETFFEFEFDNKNYQLHNLGNLTGQDVSFMAKTANDGDILAILQLLAKDPETEAVVARLKMSQIMGLFKAWNTENNMTGDDFLES